MAYRFQANETVNEGLKRIALEQLEKALSELHSNELDRDAAVHQVRKRCKKMRGLVRVVRPAFSGQYKVENRHYRDAARALSPLRDADVIIETFDDVMEFYGELVESRHFASVRGELDRRRKRLKSQDIDLDKRLRDFESRLRQGVARVEDWELSESGFNALEGGLFRVYRAGRNRMNRAYDDPSAESFHEWRKRVKYHWYHVRLLRDTWRPVMGQWAIETKALSDCLGDEHDLSVLRSTILSAPEEFGEHRTIHTLVALIDQRRAALRTQARSLGTRIYAEEPDAYVARLSKYWDAWSIEVENSATFTDSGVSPLN